MGAVGRQQAADARQVAAERQHPLRRNRNLLGLIGEVQQRQRLVGLQADEAGFFITGDADLLLVAWPQLAGTFEGDQRLIVRLTWQSMDLDHVPHIQQKHKNFYSRYINSRLEVQNYSQNT